jgi:hypothetical protein
MKPLTTNHTRTGSMFERPRKAQAKKLLESLVDSYLNDRARLESHTSKYSEAQARLDYINPFLRIFGWDVGNSGGYPYSRQEVIVEESVELADEHDIASVSRAGNPDYTLRPHGKRLVFLEAKKPSVDVLGAPAPAYQIRRYGWSAGMPVAFLTNFACFIAYDCRTQPLVSDDAATARWPKHVFRLEEYLDRFDELWRCLSRASVEEGVFSARFAVTREVRGAASFDDVFLDQVRRWRAQLAGDVAARNPTLDAVAVGRVTQSLLNCLVFLRVCEDRDLERYGDLLAIGDMQALTQCFRAADDRYNAGLFHAIDKADVNFDLVHEIVTDLYYPRSPYSFSVVEPSVLASIYEQFLAERVELRADRSVVLKRKPEVVHAGGVVATPGYVVDEILARTLDRGLAVLSTQDLDALAVGDISCGSGVFLLEVFRRLLYRLEVDCPGVERLALKHRILSQNVYGVDVDAEAIEVAKFNLLLAVLEGEDEETLRAFDGKALPDLEATIVCGNSLVAHDVFDATPDLASDRDALRAVNPFSFDDAFPQVMERGGFDVIVGNPPYVRIQTLTESQPIEVEYFRSTNHYQSAQAFNFDKYLLFIERGLDLLNQGGALGYIVPHRFMNTFAGRAVRERLSGGEHVNSIVHFGLQQVFEGKTQTYTCILVARDAPSADFGYEQVDDLARWRSSRVPSLQRRYPAKALSGGGVWSFVPDATKGVFEALRKRHAHRLADVAEIFVGVQTSADDIYFVKPTAVGPSEIEFRDPSERTWSIERDVCRLALRDRRLKPYGDAPLPDAWAIFPYRVLADEGGAGSRAELIPPWDMQANYPRCWEYLMAHRAQLQARNIQGATADTWYRYGRSQSLAKLDAEKIIVRVLSTVPRYNRDAAGLLVPGGGDGGPYYLIRPLAKSQVTILFLIALLSHPVIDAMVWEAGGREYRGGYFPHRKAFLKELPVPFEDPALLAHVAKLVEELMDTGARIEAEVDPQLHNIQRRRFAAQQRALEQVVGVALGLSDADVSLVAGT